MRQVGSYIGYILCPGEVCCKGSGASDGTHADTWRERASVTMLLLLRLLVTSVRLCDPQ